MLMPLPWSYHSSKGKASGNDVADGIVGMSLMWTQEAVGLATGLACSVGEQSLRCFWQSQQSIVSWTSRLLPQPVPGQSVTTRAVIRPSAENAEHILVAMQQEWTGASVAAAKQVIGPWKHS